MSRQEKVALNLSVMDLARIDYLVEQGYYSSRSDFMRRAIRDLLRENDAIISDENLKANLDSAEFAAETRTIGGVGVFALNRRMLEDASAHGRRLRLFVVGSLVVAKNVDLALVKTVVVSAKLYGVVKGPKDVCRYLEQLGEDGQ